MGRAGSWGCLVRLDRPESRLYLRCDTCGGHGTIALRDSLLTIGRRVDCDGCLGVGEVVNPDAVCRDCLNETGEVVPVLRDALCASCVAERDDRAAS